MTTSVSGSGLGDGAGVRETSPVNQIHQIRYESIKKTRPTDIDVPGMKPSLGNISPFGGENLNGFPSGPIRVSTMGLKERSPAKVIAVTISGDARKFIVLLFPSFRPLKLLGENLCK